MSPVAVLFLLVSFAYAAICAYCLLQPLVGRPESSSTRVRLAVISLGLGPLLLAYVVTAVMTLVPGMSHGAIISVVLIGMAALAVAGTWRQNPQLNRVVPLTLSHLLNARAVSPVALTGWIALAFVVMTVLLLAVAVPLADNDALEYAGSAKRVYEAASARVYPFVHLDDQDDYYGPWSHPMAYVALQTWGFLVQGHATQAGVIKLIAPYFALCTAAAMLHALGGARRPAAAWGAALLLATPAYLFTIVQNQIDPMRIFALFAACLLLPLLLRAPTRTARIVGIGVVVGAGIFSHSIGLLGLPIVAALILAKTRAGIGRRIAVAGAVCFVALAVVLWRLIDNLRIFGSPIADFGAVPVYQIPALEWAEYFRQSRGIATFADRWLIGFLAGLTRPPLYGITYWLLIVAFVLLWLRWWKPRGLLGGARLLWSDMRPWSIALFVVVLFQVMVLASLLVGTDAFIKNFRYMSTSLPFVILFTLSMLAPTAMRWMVATRERTR
jgi:hypothetical protein